MTTPTTNYGWLKPTATEPADIRVVNTLMDDMDADLKSVSDTLTSKIYKIGQYRLKRKINIAGAGVITYLTSTLPDLWEEEWVSPNNTAGAWTFPDTGLLSFTQAGIYKVCYEFTGATYGTSTTSGYFTLGMYNYGTNVLVPRTKAIVRSNTCDNVTNFMRTTITAAMYVVASNSSDQCALNTSYKFGVQQYTTAGNIAMLFTPNDLVPFRSQLTLECVRKL